MSFILAPEHYLRKKGEKRREVYRVSWGAQWQNLCDNDRAHRCSSFTFYDANSKRILFHAVIFRSYASFFIFAQKIYKKMKNILCARWFFFCLLIFFSLPFLCLFRQHSHFGSISFQTLIYNNSLAFVIRTHIYISHENSL